MERFSAEKHVAKIGVSASEKRIDGEYLTHWHEFYEIEYIISGNGDYVIDGKRYPIHPGALFLMTPLSFHCVSAKNCTVINVMFSERLCNAAYLAHFLKREQAIVLSLTDGEMRLMEAWDEGDAFFRRLRRFGMKRRSSADGNIFLQKD